MRKNVNDRQNPGQRTVRCPAWLQRRMMRNLRLAARSRINPKRAAKAREILVTAYTSGSTTASRPALTDTTIKTSALGAPDSTARLAPNAEGIHKSTFGLIADKAKAAIACLLHIAKITAKRTLLRKRGRRCLHHLLYCQIKVKPRLFGSQ